MHLIVLVKPIPDLANLSVSRGQQAVFEKSKRLLNPADESAVEAALTLKPALGGPVTVLTVATERDIEIVRKPLAMGADAAAAVVDPALSDAAAGSGALTPALAAAVRKIAEGEAALILCGTGNRPGGGSAQTGPRLAEALGWPCAAGVTTVSVTPDKTCIEVQEKTRDGTRTRRIALPAVCLIEPSAFKPRSTNALAIMKAVKRPIERWSSADLGIDPKAIEESLASLTVAGRQLAEDEA